MNCITCNADIPPAWVAAIAKNTCPGCDGPIMSEDHQTLLTELKEAMVKMEHNPEGLAGWLLSTYDLRKKGDSVEPTEFYGQKRQHNQQGPEGPTQGLRWANSPTHEFTKRAGADRVTANKFSSVVDAINNVNANLYGGPSQQIHNAAQDEEDVVTNGSEEEDMRTKFEMATMVAAKEKRKVTMMDILSSNVLVDTSSSSGPGIEIEDSKVLSTALFGNDDGGANLPPALQADRMKRLANQQGVSFGGAGKIRRGGGEL